MQRLRQYSLPLLAGQILSTLVVDSTMELLHGAHMMFLSTLMKMEVMVLLLPAFNVIKSKITYL